MNIIRNFRDESIGLDLDSLTEIKLYKNMSRTTIHYYRGFYINCQGNLVGVIATGKGPAFFHNMDIFFLRERPFRFTLESDPYNNTVHFIYDGRLRMKVTYAREQCLPGGVCLEDERHDFFIWLVRAVDNRKFYDFYTLKKAPPLACSLAEYTERNMSSIEHNSQNSVSLDDAIRRADEILDILDEETNQQFEEICNQLTVVCQELGSRDRSNREL